MRIKLLALLICLWLIPIYPIYANETFRNQKASWYALGLKHPEAFTTACWDTFPKGTRFLVSYRYNFIITTCDDRGSFQFNGSKVFLDLSSGSFAALSPLSKGILTVDIERLN